MAEFHDDVFVPSESILMFKSAAMKRSRETAKAGRPLVTSSWIAEDTETVTMLKGLYDKHGGKIEPLFKELGDHPGKALKYPPKDSAEFAKRYIGGYYTYINLADVLSKHGLDYVPEKPEPVTEAVPRGVRRTKLDRSASEIAPDPDDGARNPEMRPATPQPKAAAGKESQPSPAPSGPFKGGNDMRGVNSADLTTSLVTLRRRPDRPITAGTNLLLGPSDEETAPLIALWFDHNGNLEAIFKELGESPRKALKHPPADAMDFATKFLAGKLSDYAAPKPLPGFEERVLNNKDAATSPLQALAAIFPALPQEVLFAVLEATNGSLEGAVELLLQSGANLQEDRPDAAPLRPPKRNEVPAEANMSAMQQAAAPPDPDEDFVLAITVPMGSRPNALLKITTTIGTVHARVPPGVTPGQSFFIRMRRGSPYASAT